MSLMPEIQKVPVLDSVLNSQEARYAVAVGASQVTNTPYTNNNGSSTSIQQFMVQSPDYSTRVERGMDWSAYIYLSFVCTVTGAFAVNDPVCVMGRDIALAPYPLGTLINQNVVQINNSSISLDTGLLSRELLRLSDRDQSRLMKTCPAMLDRYASMNDAYGAINNSMASFLDSTDAMHVPNGAWPDFDFTDPTGAVLSGAGTYTSGGININYVNGVPVGTSNGGLSTVYNIFVRFRSSEKLMISPFAFSDQYEWDTGLFNVQNIKVQMTLQAPSVGRTIRNATSNGRTLSALAFNSTATNGAIQESQLNVLFYTPRDVSSQPKQSVVPYMEYVAQAVQSSNAAMASGASSTIVSQTIQLSGTPDLLILYCKPDSYLATDGDFYLPIDSLTLQYDNDPGLCSTLTREELYQFSVRNGLNMSYPEWIGQGKSAQSSLDVPLCGGLVVLRPGIDFPVRTGNAPGREGKFQLRYTATVRNQTAVNRTPVLYVALANSGFFTSVNGLSSYTLFPLQEEDVLRAVAAPSGERGSLRRIVGGSIFSSLSNVFNKAKDLYSMTKPMISTIKNMASSADSEGAKRVGEVLGKIGYGKKKIESRF